MADQVTQERAKAPQTVAQSSAQYEKDSWLVFTVRGEAWHPARKATKSMKVEVDYCPSMRDGIESYAALRVEGLCVDAIPRVENDNEVILSCLTMESLETFHAALGSAIKKAKVAGDAYLRTLTPAKSRRSA